MPKRKTHGKTSISLPLELIERLEAHKDEINISRLCAEALDAALKELEGKPKEAEGKRLASQEGQNRYSQEILIERGYLPMPPALSDKISHYLPHERQAFMNGWQAGTADVFRTLTTNPPLPFEYEPGQK